MRFNKPVYYIAAAIIAMVALNSCLDDNDTINDYSEWRLKNATFFEELGTETDENGALVYEKLSPVWDKSFYILFHRHNEWEEGGNHLTPLSNSTVNVKYTLTNIEGDTLDSSASMNCTPNSMITGFWTALTNMREKDTVTAVIPYSAAYGVYGSGAILPYSTLIFGIRLDSIIAYEWKP